MVRSEWMDREKREEGRRERAELDRKESEVERARLTKEVALRQQHPEQRDRESESVFILFDL